MRSCAAYLYLHAGESKRKPIGSVELNKKNKTKANCTEREQSRKSVQIWELISRFQGGVLTNTWQPHGQTKQRSLPCQQTVSRNNTCSSDEPCSSTVAGLNHCFYSITILSRSWQKGHTTSNNRRTDVTQKLTHKVRQPDSSALMNTSLSRQPNMLRDL